MNHSSLNLLDQGLEKMLDLKDNWEVFEKTIKLSEHLTYSENEIQELIDLKVCDEDSFNKRYFDNYFGIYITALSSNLIKNDCDEIHINWNSKLNYLGYKWNNGKLIINGNAGMSLGSDMEGGIIELFGCSGACAGFFMNNGSIKIYGNADHDAGSYMKGGSVEIFGDAEFDAGCNQMGGLLFIHGDAKISAGRSMRGGALIAKNIEKISKFYGSGAIISSNHCKGVDELIKNNPNSIPLNLIPNDILKNPVIYENMEKIFCIPGNHSQESNIILKDFKKKLEWAINNL